MTNWLIRAAISIPLLCGLALIVKYYLIEPEFASVLDFEIQVEQIFRGEKGDKEI